MSLNIYTYIHMSVNIYTHLHMSLNIHKHIHMSLNIHKCIHMSLNIYKHIHMLLNIYKHIHMSLNIYKHIHMSLNIHKLQGPGWLNELTTHTSLSPIWRGVAPGFVNYKNWCTQLTAASDKVYQFLAHGRWFSLGTPASSTTKTGRHDIAEILLKVVLKHQKSNHYINAYICH